jgi:AAHS family 4-hydroxybenzoate transporter-like MFS transporter
MRTLSAVPVATAPRQVDIAALIDDSPVGPWQMGVFVLCALISMLDGFDLQIAGSLAPLLADALGLPPSAFGPIFAAGFFGIMVGSLVMGEVADRVGRKRVIIASMLLFGLFTLAVPALHATGSLSFASLLACRFIGGLGIGGVMPNVLALTSEYAPRRSRALIINTMYCGVPLGSVLVGVTTAALATRAGWPVVFAIGGVLPIVLGFVAVALLPESARYLAASGAPSRRIAALLHRMRPDAPDPDDDTTVYVIGEARRRPSLRALIADGRAAPTLLLWLAMFCNLLVVVFVLSWLPAVMRQAGLGMPVAVLLAALFSFGGIAGSVVIGRLIDRLGSAPVLAATYALAAVAVSAYGLVGQSVPSLYAVTLLAGACAIGAQSGINAFAATLYPTAMRATGLGWALGIGRLGSIVGPALGGLMLARHWTVTEIFLAAAGPAALAAVTMLTMRIMTAQGATSAPTGRTTR